MAVNKVTVLKGLPGSGKTTWAKAQLTDSRVTVRVNKDDLRKMLFGDAKRQGWHERLVIDIRDAIIGTSLFEKKNVIVDDTNFNPIHEKRIREIAEVSGAKVEVKTFDTPLGECIDNDLKRDRSVGETVIRDMHDMYIRPTLRFEQDPALDEAVIFDLDGTLALMGDRNPYDASDCEYDKLNHDVFDAMMRHKQSGHAIIICSGRSSQYLPQTDRWLGKMGIQPDLFLMRKEGDTRKDSVVKKEMFINEIAPKYYVNVVYDDRQQVVDMWRDLGLTVFHVADGRF